MIATLRNAVVTRLVAEGIVPEGCVLNGHLAATPPTKVRAITVSIGETAGKVGSGASYACDAGMVVQIECSARGLDDTETADAVDALVWLALRALLIDPTFRDAWPLQEWKDRLGFLPEAGKSVQVRTIAAKFAFPVDFTTTPTGQLQEIGAAFDAANIVDGADGEETLMEETILVGDEEEEEP